jgi:hypothetical protein
MVPSTGGRSSPGGPSRSHDPRGSALVGTPVGSDMDLARTFIGGSEECIDALAARNELDVERVTLDVRVDGTHDLARLVKRG